MSKVKMVVVKVTMMMLVFNEIVTWPGVEERCLMQKGLPWTSVTTTRSASPVLSAPGSARDMETILKILFPDNFEKSYSQMLDAGNATEAPDRRLVCRTCYSKLHGPQVGDITRIILNCFYCRWQF